MKLRAFLPSLSLLLPALTASLFSAAPPNVFLERYCYECHDADTKKGDLDLTSLKQDFTDPRLFEKWEKVHDVIAKDEMPPKKKKRPPVQEAQEVTDWLDKSLLAADRQAATSEGRAVIRRLTRTEYENAIRDLLDMPDLSIKEMLPADGLREGYDKVGEALDLSHVQLSRYMDAVNAALDAAIATSPTAPPVVKTRIYPCAQSNMHKAVGTGNAVLLRKGEHGFEQDPIWPAPGKLINKAYKDSFTEAAKAGVPQSHSAVAFFHPNVVYLQTSYGFSPIFSGKYKLRLSLWSLLWDAGSVQPSPKTEVAMLHVGSRTLGYFDAPSLSPLVTEITPWLEKNGEVFFNSASLYVHEGIQVRQLPGGAAAYTGPAIATDWLEVEGPFNDEWPPQSHKRLFGDLPIRKFEAKPGVKVPKRTPLDKNFRSWPMPSDYAPEVFSDTVYSVASDQPQHDAATLLAKFLRRAYHRPVSPEEVQRYVALMSSRLEDGECFEDAMRYAYKAALTSANFLFRLEPPGKLDDAALAVRLSTWLWNSLPDDELLALVREGKLHLPLAMDAQIERMLKDPKSERFITDFLDQWLKLRDINSTDPDAELYPEFHVYLKDSMVAESRAYMRELIEQDMPITNLVASDFLMMNERLADHYLFVGPKGSQIRRVPIGNDTERGGFITQGAVLKVTANGTVTSPVIRGIWLSDRILGTPVPPPPPGVPAIDPDTHGATTIREQLIKHRADPACAACHARIDPPGFALESFDVIGRFREAYRSRGAGQPTPIVYPGGWRPKYKIGPPVECSGALPDGRKFADIKALRKFLVDDPDQLVRNFARHLLIYATGAPLGYADRKSLESIVAESKSQGYGIRKLLHTIAKSEIFMQK
jgi:Protein of unknown function (DUF1592)/Protein of unknown function (DUF1588)/Protein of unknown function (DUF1585)/Protein of unknown function (DUF1587)/Protein of unknown function (DUF1595)/Planctomycete cytochrome C